MPRLTEQEQQEIIRFIEADKPLPDKYRFLLFEDKREVELVWNGKTNEVCNIVLPFQTIEQVDEPRAEKPSEDNLQLGLFDTRGRQRKGWTNKLIWGDNNWFCHPSRTDRCARRLKHKVDSNSSISIHLLMWGRIFLWISKLVRIPLPKIQISLKRSPTETLGDKERILLLR